VKLLLLRVTDDREQLASDPVRVRLEYAKGGVRRDRSVDRAAPFA